MLEIKNSNNKLRILYNFLEYMNIKKFCFEL